MLKIFIVQGRRDWLLLFVSILLSLGTGFIGRFLVQNPKELYSKLILPEFAPPVFLFVPIWTILYLLMGIAIYRITIHDGILRADNAEKVVDDITNSENFLAVEEANESLEQRSKNYAYGLFALQLLTNFLWSIIFFHFAAQVYALIDIIILVVFIVLTMREFYKFDRTATQLLVPYLLWVIFAGSLNFGIVILNTFY